MGASTPDPCSTCKIRFPNQERFSTAAACIATTAIRIRGNISCTYRVTKKNISRGKNLLSISLQVYGGVQFRIEIPSEKCCICGPLWPCCCLKSLRHLYGVWSDLITVFRCSKVTKIKTRSTKKLVLIYGWLDKDLGESIVVILRGQMKKQIGFKAIQQKFVHIIWTFSPRYK